MDFIVKKDYLIAGIDKCAQAVDPKHQNPAFRMMRIDVRKNKLRCSAVGEYCSVETATSATAKETGGFNVIPGRLRDIASSMPDGEIRFTMKGTRVTAKSVTSARKATFESPVTDVYTVDDPGKDAPWQQLHGPELVRVIKTARHSSVPESDDTVPAMLLVPSERGMDVFACNGYIITLAESKLRMTGESAIQLPLLAVNIINLMVEDDDKVRIFQTENRLYIENGSTLVSVRLTEYKLAGVYGRYIELIKRTDNPNGPSFKLASLIDSTKSVLATGGFATGNERGSRGYQLRTRFGTDTVGVALALSEADADDEFDVISIGLELHFKLSSSFFLKLLDSLTGADEVQALSANEDNMLILRSQGIIGGIMKEGG